jgi:hypothetical protein
MIHYPKGAIKSIYNLKKAAVPGAVFYMIFFDSYIAKYRWHINENFKIQEDHVDRRWRFKVDTTELAPHHTERYEKHHFWSPFGDLNFPTTAGKYGYLFDNYWHVYAYELKLKEPT